MSINRIQVCKRNLPGFFIFLLCSWVLASSLYYIGNLFSGDVWASRDSNEFHKAFKYAAAFLLSVSSLVLLRVGRLFFYYIFLALILFFFVCVWLLGWNVLYAIDFFIVFMSFVGMIVLVSSLDNNDLNLLVYVLIASGFFVGCFSLYEFFFLDAVLGSYWESTGGYRSISTLLNPNNLGLYVGAVILLLYKSDAGMRHKVLLLCFFMVVLMMSGSRTAVLALVASGVLNSVYLGEKRFRPVPMLIWLVSIFLFGAIYIYLLDVGGLPERAVDMQTAFIRVEKYFQYLLDFDFEYIFPDVDEERVVLVSESSYFHALNSLGLFFLSLIALSFFTFFVVKPVSSVGGWSVEAFRIVFVYYLIASFFENVFMSFPNNQLFFMSAGCVFGLRCLSSEKNRSW